MDRLRCKNTPCGNLVLAECPNSQCHMHCEGCVKHNTEPVKKSARSTDFSCIGGATSIWHYVPCKNPVHPHCSFSKCANHCDAYMWKTGECFHPELYDSIETFNKHKEAQKEQQLRDVLLICTFGDNCDCQAPKGCKNAMCSDHCTGCDIHKAVTTKTVKKPQVKASPVIVPDIHCIAYEDCLHIASRECMYTMCGNHCPGCAIHKKDYEDELKPKIRKEQEFLSNMRIDESLHRAVKARNIDLVTRLLSEGKNMYALDINENSSVYYACLVGDIDILKMFLDRGYELDLGSVEGQRCRLSAHSQEIINLLKKRCIDTTLKTKMWFDNCYRGKVDAIQKFHKEGFDVNARDANGYNGLDLAVFSGNTEVANYLKSIVFPSIHLDMKKLVNSQYFADMKISIKGHTIYAHKALVMLRLPLWNTLLESTEEDKDKFRVSQNFDYLTCQTLVDLLEFLYTGTAFLPPGQLDALSVVAAALKLEYLCQWCSHVKIKQYKTVVPPDPDLLKDLKEMFNSNYQSDITFNVQNQQVYAHKFMLGTRSEYFYGMFSSNMLEATQDTITIDTSYTTFTKALEFIYINSITLNGLNAEYIIEVIELSVKWLLRSLNNFCDKLLCSEYTIDSENVSDLLQFSQVYNVNNLYKKCLNFNKKT